MSEGEAGVAWCGDVDVGLAGSGEGRVEGQGEDGSGSRQPRV